MTNETNDDVIALLEAALLLLNANPALRSEYYSVVHVLKALKAPVSVKPVLKSLLSPPK